MLADSSFHEFEARHVGLESVLLQKFEMQIHDIEMELEKLTGKKNIKPRKEKEAELETVKKNVMYLAAKKQLADAEVKAK